MVATSFARLIMVVAVLYSSYCYADSGKKENLVTHQRLALFEAAIQRCLGDPLASSNEETMLYQLNMCGFYVKPDVTGEIAPSLYGELKQKILEGVSIASLDHEAYHQGMVHVETVDSTELRNSILLHPILDTAVPTNPVLSDVYADIYNGPSLFIGPWRRYGFLFKQSLLAQYGLAPSDADFPVRLDVIVPLRDTQSSEIEVCIGSHYLAGMTTEDCKFAGSSSQVKKYCELLVKGECPKGHIFRARVSKGSVLVVAATTLRRSVGSDSDLRKPRVDLHLVLRYGWWYSNPQQSVWEILPNQLKSEMLPSNSTKPINNDDQDHVDERLVCAVGDGGESHCEADSIENQGKLFFANRDIRSDINGDVTIYFGNDRLLARLPPGHSVVVPTLAGTYTLRIDGVSRKVWQVQRANITAAFYACKESLDFPP